MRILHTSDWHLGERLGDINRQADLEERLKEIANYLEQEAVDVMVVAGDIFSDQYPRFRELQSIMERIKNIFEPFIQKGGTMVWISGNHDNEDLFQFLRESFRLASPIKSAEKIHSSGRLYIFSHPAHLRLANRQGTKVVQFALLPYPTKRRYLKNDSILKSRSELNRELHNNTINTLYKLRNELEKYPDCPSVLIGHGYIKNSEISHTIYKLDEKDDIIFGSEELRIIDWAYIGYGHIHKPQALGAEHIRYSGSIERLDKGEAADEKSVTLIEIGQNNQVKIKQLPLNATPIYDFGKLTTTIEIPELLKRYPYEGKAIATYELIYNPGEDNFQYYIENLENAFPSWRWYNRRIYPSPIISEGVIQPVNIDTGNVLGTIRDYLTQNVADETQREELLFLVTELLKNQNTNKGV